MLPKALGLLILAGSLLLAPYAGAQCTPTAQQLIDACQQHFDNALNKNTADADAATLNSVNNGTAIHGSNQSVADNLDSTSGNASLAAQNCGDVATYCQKIICTDLTQKQPEQKKCTDGVNKIKQNLQDLADGTKAQADEQRAAAPQSAGSGSGGGAGMGALMGALGGLAGALMKPQTPDPAPTPTYGALQPNCSVNCAMSDGYQYGSCDSYNVTACMPSSSTTATSTTTVDCNSFTQRYCATTAAADTAAQCVPVSASSGSSGSSSTAIECSAGGGRHGRHGCRTRFYFL